MRRCLETMQTVGSWRHNFPHSVHGVCTGHGDNLCTWGTWRRNMQHPGGVSQCRHEQGCKNDAAWEAIETGGKNCAPNIQTARDIQEGKASPLRHPKEGALHLT